MKYLLTGSRDGIGIDYEAIISEEENNFWTCYIMAANHGCEFWDVQETEEVCGAF